MNGSFGKRLLCVEAVDVCACGGSVLRVMRTSPEEVWVGVAE